MATFTIVPHLSFTKINWTRFTRVAKFLASMGTIFSWLHASLTTAVFHEFFNCGEALSFFMAYFLADMSTFQGNSALLTTVWSSSMTVNFVQRLFATLARFSYWFEAWRTST